jgi:dihydroflavonol-4-reductase
MIFVTGGTGLLGSYLIAELVRQGAPVRALYRGEKPTIVGVDWVKGDVLDVVSLEAAMQGVQQVYHSAAVVSFLPAKRAMMHQINIQGTANVVNAALDAKIDKMVHVSSVAALGRIRPGQLIDETMSWTEATSNSEYGKSKYLSEMEVWRGMGEGLNVVVVNPSIILGAGDWENGSSKIFKTYYGEFPWYTTGSGGFVDVKDVVSAMIGLMNSPIVGEKFVVNGGNEQYQTIFNMVADAFGKKRPHKKVTPLIAAIVWRLAALKSFFTGKEPLVTKETAKTALANVQFSNQKLLAALPGFAYTPMAQTIREHAAALKQKHNLS